MNNATSPYLVLAVYATTRGFAFTLFEDSHSLVDWGVKEIGEPKKNTRCLESITKLIGSYRPDVVVLENCRTPATLRTSRIRRLYAAIEAWNTSRALDTHLCSRSEIRETFSMWGASTKEQIADIIAQRLPEFEHRRPPVRRPWMSEDSRMGLFDAAALAFTFFNSVRNEL